MRDAITPLRVIANSKSSAKDYARR
jgi:hypothetical protein